MVNLSVSIVLVMSTCWPPRFGWALLSLRNFSVGIATYTLQIYLIVPWTRICSGPLSTQNQDSGQCWAWSEVLGFGLKYANEIWVILWKKHKSKILPFALKSAMAYFIFPVKLVVLQYRKGNLDCRLCFSYAIYPINVKTPKCNTSFVCRSRMHYVHCCRHWRTSYFAALKRYSVLTSL